MCASLRKLTGILLLLTAALFLMGQTKGADAAVQAIRLQGDYLGTYTPTGGSASQLQMFLDDPGAGGAFTGQGNIRVNGVLHPVDIEGIVKKKNGKTTFKATLTGTEFNDNVTLTGKLKGSKISGSFKGTVGGPNINGKFKLEKV